MDNNYTTSKLIIFKMFRQDYVKVIHNEGMPDMNDPSQRGDIIIRFDITYPLYLPIADDTFCESFIDNKINT